MFALSRYSQQLRASGVASTLPIPNCAAVAEWVAGFFARAPEGAAMLVGALPFDTQARIELVQPKIISHIATAPTPAVPAPLSRPAFPNIVERPRVAAYAGMVRQALARITAPDAVLRKVVLSRSLRIDMGVPLDPEAIAANLSADSDVTVFLADLPARPGGGRRTLVGATPELLVSRRGRTVTSHPLAGSARRGADAASDRANGEALFRSEKDRREHALAAEAVLDLLAPYCAQLSAPEGMALCSTATMWHLGTRIEGELKDDAPSAAGLAALLHPTPAVGGTPRAAALEAIRALEPHDRGYYAGAVGWVDAAGDGEWHVALRCAEVEGSRLTLHAGAGIVAGSDPEGEAAETTAKFRAMLLALGLDDAPIALDTAA